MNNHTENNGAVPSTIADYLDQLRLALQGADPAVIQDALYDAEEYLRSELATRKEPNEASLLAEMLNSYGKPSEVADIYLERESVVNQAFHFTKKVAADTSAAATKEFVDPAINSVAPATSLGQPQMANNAVSPSWLKRFFGVATDPRAYMSVLYMLMSLATGIFYFTWTVTGVSLSLALSILIIGLPFALAFLGTMWVLSLVEGRLVESLLGERMPRRPQYTSHTGGVWERIRQFVSDPRLWATFVYFLAMLPLGTIYFTVIVTSLALSVGFLGAPIAYVSGFAAQWSIQIGHWQVADHPGMLPFLFALGFIGVFVTLHIARAIGRLHARIAKHLLVKLGE
jgi:hypothetical protein